MRFGSSYLAVDWGTTNRRVFLVENGKVVRTERDDRGVTAIAAGEFPAEAAGIRDRFGDLPMLMAGMVGSTIGWQVAPYVPAPTGVEAIAANLLWIDDRTAIVPGISSVEDGRADVMRGEEVQLLGAVAAGMTPADALLCHPGTHCKWVTMEGGSVTRFTTAMTGELFALLRNHSVLAPQLAAAVTPDTAFLAGVEEGRRRDLVASLFGIRAAKMLGLRDDNASASFASGLVIGSDVAVRVEQAPGDTIYILADPLLAQLYSAAIEAHGRRAEVIDGQAAFVAGIIEIERHLA
jgi:2-dehydro-3-deoxygalactonokinase